MGFPLGVLIPDLALILFVITAALLGDASARRFRRQSSLVSVHRAFRDAARRMGLRFLKDRRQRSRRCEGSIDGDQITAECTSESEGRWLTTITVSPQSALPDGFWLQSRWQPGQRHPPSFEAAGDSALATGDAALDPLLAVGGRPALAHALLTAPARQALVALAQRGAVAVRNGRLTFRTIERVWNAEQLITFIRNVLETARALPEVADPLSALEHLARQDPVAGVRSRCLSTLMAEFPDGPRTSSTVEAALSDASAAVRVVAATALGERGVPVLREIAARDDADDDSRCRAVARLGQRLTGAETIAILDGALASQRHALALATILALGHVGDSAAIQRLVDLLHQPDEEIQAAAAQALGLTHSTSAEPALIAALDSSWPAVAHAAATALGAVGGVAAAARLRELGSNTATEATLRTLARHALSAIQTRLPDTSPGHLSLTTGDSGQVSIADDDRGGRLSVTDRHGA